MKLIKLSVAILSVLVLSGVLMTSAMAWPCPTLPSTMVTLNQTNLTPYDYPFLSLLSNVPPGFDVSNGMYTGWCIDLVGHVTRGVDYPVLLLCSLSLSLPAPYNSLPWDMINYVLNHKQGTGVDISQAIWYFCNGNAWPTAAQLPSYPFTLPPTTLAQAMVTDALTNGSGYVPGPSKVVAVICDPEDVAAQDTIIEVTIPGLNPGLSPGFWKHNVGVCLGLANGSYSDPTGSPVVTKNTMGTWLHAHWTNAELLALYNALNTKGGGAAGAATRNNAANVFNALAGLALF
jgi:hypothetical protein